MGEGREAENEFSGGGAKKWPKSDPAGHRKGAAIPHPKRLPGGATMAHFGLVAGAAQVGDSQEFLLACCWHRNNLLTIDYACGLDITLGICLGNSNVPFATAYNAHNSRIGIIKV